MKLNTTNAALLAFTGAWVCLGAACAAGLKFKTTDSSTGQPLDAARAQWREDYSDLLFGSKQFGPISLSPSGTDGVITVSNTHSGWTGRLIVTRAGYSIVYAVYSHTALTLADRTFKGSSQGKFILEGKLALAATTNGVFIIPMFPAAKANTP